MKHPFWKWPPWALALTLSALMGVITVIINLMIPAFEVHEITAWFKALRVAVYLTVLVAAILYAELAEEVFGDKWVAWFHRVAAGLIGGISCDLLLERHLDLKMLVISAMVGAVLSALGVFGLVARGL